MNGGVPTRAAALVMTLVTVPGVAAAQPGVATVADAPGVVRAVGSVAAVGLLGGAILARRGGFVDRAVDDTMDRPAVAIVYGLFAYVFVVFAGLYVNNVLSQVGAADTPAGGLVVGVLGGGVALLGSLGFLVVGTLLTDLYGARSRRRGLLVGAGLSGIAWLALPVAAAFVAWVLVAAFGVGGPTRTWVHSSRSVASEASD